MLNRFLLLAGLVVASVPFASAAPPASATASVWSEGTVRKLDVAAGNVTLAHGPLANLGMPAMTMRFVATPASLLKGVKVGDRVRFVAEERDGKLAVTAIEVARQE